MKMIIRFLARIIGNESSLPRRSFKIDQGDSSGPNLPYCVCDHCDRVIYKWNFYHCEEKGCLVAPNHSKEVMSKRLVPKDRIK